MRRIVNLRTGAKLGLGFSFCIAATFLIGLISLIRMNFVASSLSQTYKDEVVSGLVSKMRSTLLLYQRAEQNIIIEPNPDYINGRVFKMVARAKTINETLSRLKGAVYTDSGRTTVARVEQIWRSYYPSSQHVIQLVKDGHVSEAHSISKNKEITLLAAADQAIDDYTKLLDEQGKKADSESAAMISTGGKESWLIMLAAALISSGIAFGLTSHIARPLMDIVGKAEALALGDVDQHIAVNRNDEVGKLGAAFQSLIIYQTEMTKVAQAIASGNLTQNIAPKSEKDALGVAFSTMVNSLNSTISQVAASAQSVSSTGRQLAQTADQTGRVTADIARSILEVAQAADQTSTTSQEMARGSEQQAHSAAEAEEEMVTLHQAVKQVQAGGDQQQAAARQANEGMHEASRAVEAVSRSSQQMADAASEANSVARSGGVAVEQTIASMVRIQEQVTASAAKIAELGELGKAIGAIVSTIDQIADQTNLLALNAAIEAARAGEHGKGFAVVANEVRILAERAATATGEVRTLISGVRSGVEDAVRAMQISSTEVTEGAKRSQEAGQALTLIMNAAERVASEVQTVSRIAADMSTSIQDVTATIESVGISAEENQRAVDAMAVAAEHVSTIITSVAAVSEETAAGAEEMSASAEEVSTSARNVSVAVEQQGASVQEVNVAAGELNIMAERLQHLVSAFRLDEVTPTDSQVSVNRAVFSKAA